jgi:hypothetical protein
VEARARALGFGALKPTVDEFYARLSPEIRARYDSPEKLWAVLLAGSPQAARVTAFELVAQKPGPAGDANALVLHVRTQKEGGVIEQGDMAFERSGDGWRRTLPTNLITPIFDLFPSAKNGGGGGN